MTAATLPLWQVVSGEPTTIHTFLQSIQEQLHAAAQQIQHQLNTIALIPHQLSTWTPFILPYKVGAQDLHSVNDLASSGCFLPAIQARAPPPVRVSSKEFPPLPLKSPPPPEVSSSSSPKQPKQAPLPPPAPPPKQAPLPPPALPTTKPKKAIVTSVPTPVFVPQPAKKTRLHGGGKGIDRALAQLTLQREEERVNRNSCELLPAPEKEPQKPKKAAGKSCHVSGQTAAQKRAARKKKQNQAQKSQREQELAQLEARHQEQKSLELQKLQQTQQERAKQQLASPSSRPDENDNHHEFRTTLSSDRLVQMLEAKINKLSGTPAGVDLKFFSLVCAFRRQLHTAKLQREYAALVQDAVKDFVPAAWRVFLHSVSRLRELLYVARVGATAGPPEAGAGLLKILDFQAPSHLQPDPLHARWPGLEVDRLRDWQAYDVRQPGVDLSLVEQMVRDIQLHPGVALATVERDVREQHPRWMVSDVLDSDVSTFMSRRGGGGLWTQTAEALTQRSREVNHLLLLWEFELQKGDEACRRVHMADREKHAWIQEMYANLFMAQEAMRLLGEDAEKRWETIRGWCWAQKCRFTPELDRTLAELLNLRCDNCSKNQGSYALCDKTCACRTGSLTTTFYILVTQKQELAAMAATTDPYVAPELLVSLQQK